MLPTDEAKSGHRQPSHALRRINISIWLWELLSLLVSMMCITAIIVILAHYNRQPVPTWSYGLTINGVISILAVTAKSSLVLPVAEAISQLKWAWFWKKQHPVQDFERFDSSSRGPWGSLILLCHPRAWDLAALGAALTLAAVAVEPSLQQITSYPPMLVRSDGVASVPRSTYYYDVEYDALGDGIMSSALKGAIYRGIFTSTGGTGLGVTPTCSTGNCTWPSYTSLGVCSACENVTSLLTYVHHYPWTVAEGDPITEWTLPNSASISNNTRKPDDTDASNYTTWMVASGAWDSLRFQNLANQSIADASYLYVPPLQNTSFSYSQPHDFECMLLFCVKTYNASMTNGVFQETVTSSWPGPNDTLPYPKGFHSNETNTGINTNFTLLPPGSDTPFTIHMRTFYLLMLWMNDLLNMNYNNNPTNPEYADWPGSVDVPEAFYDSQMSDIDTLGGQRNRTINIGGPGPIFERIAEGMTSRIRSIAESGQTAVGTAYSIQTSVEAR